ncbi:hypothetical protein [Halovivax sp.]|uniref:hypothetical protein n=1 Tax=Halovivax sp. TaxID=1935978 RepID=UPI0025BC402C|nr:hypothetical protein [Halovivax sp.]
MSTDDLPVDEPTDAAVGAERAKEATARDDEDAVDRADLVARAELLAEENRRLRGEYARARRTRYRRTALGLVAVGVVAIAGALVFPDARTVLFALGATGLFGGVLTYYLTPERFVAAAVGERVYDAGASNLAAVADELGLQDQRIYLPADATGSPRLFVPQRPGARLPDDRDGPIVTDEDARGLLLEPTGAPLFAEFERAVTGDPASTPAPLAGQLADALVEQFELVRGADPDIDPDGGRATVAITDSAYGPLDRFDHPIPSVLAVGFAVGLDRPVRLDVDAGDERADWLVTCRWETSDADEDEADATAANADEADAAVDVDR